MNNTVIQPEKTRSTEPSLISRQEAVSILEGKYSLPELVRTAYEPREKYFGKSVRIHILDNIKNGHCPEDCGYCAQRKNASSGIEQYSMKSLDELYADAIAAKKNGAYRFCMVTAGTGPNDSTVEKLSGLIEKINSELGLKVCLSAGLLDEAKAERLRKAGLDRYNHNVNTSEAHYGEICTTHTFAQRMKTLEFLDSAGIGLCSGVIVGMGESFADIADMAFTVKKLGVISIPVNFFIPVEGHAIRNPSVMTPELCIRILSVFRLVNPDSEVRIAAGREGHLRSLQAMALYPANSLFASGYLNVKGSDMEETVRMIRDLGFEPETDGEPLPEIKEDALYSSDNIKSLYKFPKK